MIQGIVIFVIIVLVLYVWAALSNFHRKYLACCDVCGIKLKRSAYVWYVDKKKRTVCPNCNRRFERQQSKAA